MLIMLLFTSLLPGLAELLRGEGDKLPDTALAVPARGQ